LVHLILLRNVPHSTGDEVEFGFAQSFDCAVDSHRFLGLFARADPSIGKIRLQIEISRDPEHGPAEQACESDHI